MAETEKKTDSEMMRRFKQNPLVFIGTFFVLVLVIVAFVMPSSLGLSGAGRNTDLTFGYYDKVPISYVPGNFFAQAYEAEARSRQNDAGAANSQAVWRGAFESAAMHTAILQEMKKSGYAAPAKTVDREVAQLPQFQENGRFSAALYRQMDESQRLSLWRQVQESLVKSRYYADISGLLRPASESAFISSMGAIERSFEMAVFPIDAYPDSEYEAYVRQNPDMFRSARLSVVTVKAGEREAQAVLDSVKSGETTFEDAARAHSADSYADRGGDMGGARMPHELRFEIPGEADREAVMGLARGEYSGIVKTDAGWAFFRAEDDVQEADIEDPAIMDKARAYIRSNLWGHLEDWATAQAEGFIEQAVESGFEEAAAGQGVQVRRFGPVPINYGNFDLFTGLPSPRYMGSPSADEIAELAGAEINENFWKTAFATPIDTPSKPVVQGRNVLVLLPTSETDAEEATVEFIGTVYSNAMGYIAEQVLKQHILNSPKMENNFANTYKYLFQGQ